MRNSPEAPSFHLQDSRGNVGDNLMWWAIGGGYTSDLSKAEPFSEFDAFKQHASRESDIPWPTGYLRDHARPVVDMQYLPRHEEIPFEAMKASGLFYVQDANRRYIGNDICFRTRDGSSATNLGLAGLFRADELDGIPGIAWPRTLVEAQRRPAVDAGAVDHKTALSDPWLRALLVKPERQAPERYRCHGCGVFMTVGNYYGSACQRCGKDNRP
ncbi:MULTISPECIES: hypothetical protein [unclassified Variovorax]|uniref:hypothetical protein n=1 Tax=unclassified Variovorax TaxID=663243 RepID=UPI001317FB13|nr:MULTISPECIES: hypothetical protein [unclassified Variovorax]VTU42941.1 hypothetical protein SRS16P1_00397 [Variovorax sp. SRS16]VTU42972.1 hypothetical protein E5P1_00395 [Variovorax sp. PBL-E5]VTU43568.1 hypothetical protein H6P1_00509 [Variovorax sp. PBL-H6]